MEEPYARHSRAEPVQLASSRINSLQPCALSCLSIGGHSRIRTYDFHRVKVALYR